MEGTKISYKSEGKKGYTFTKYASASINPDLCVNCGSCRDVCPVNAVSEQQRIVCRLCPSCTSKDALTFSQMTSLATEKSCTTACPLGISPQGYINLVKNGKEAEAYEHIWKRNPLPAVCARICDHPCEQACKRGILVDEAMSIRGIKRYLTDNNRNYVPKRYPNKYEERVAIIGAGPAGITAAHYLGLSGFDVTIFDSAEEPGGTMMRAIPDFRLPKDAIREEIAKLEKAGMKFELGYHVTKTAMKEIQSEFDAVVIAAGTPHSKKLNIEGSAKDGVFTALAFMDRINNNLSLYRHPGQTYKEGGNAVIIGGGNVAIDCARTARRLGFNSVKMICIEDGEYIPGHEWELDATREEGIEIIPGYIPLKYTGSHNDLAGVRFGKVINYVRDENGKVTFDVDEEAAITVDANLVVEAIGQAPDEFWNEYKETENVFFAGQIIDRTASVVTSMASGKKVANKVESYLNKYPVKDLMELRKTHLAPVMQKVYPATRLKIDRPAMPIADPDTRINNFDEVETEYSKDVIDIEVQRCLQCGYQAVDAAKCIGCGACMEHCPMGNVITMVPVEEGGEH